MKVVQEQLGPSSWAIPAATYTSVLPAVAHAAAETVTDVVPRRLGQAAEGSRNDTAATPLAVRLQSDSPEGSVRTEREIMEANEQLRQGAPSGTRTPNPLIQDLSFSVCLVFTHRCC